MANTTIDANQKFNGVVPHDQKNKLLTDSSQMEKFTHAAGEKIGQMSAQLSNAAGEYMDTSRGYIKDNPVRAVAISAGVGMVTGALLTLLMRRR